MAPSLLNRPLLWCMNGSFVLMGLVMGMTGPLVPGLRQDLHLSYAEAGLLFSAQSVGSFVVLLLGGWLVHVIGKKRILFSGALLFVMGMVLTALAANFWWVLAGNILIGTGMSLLDIGVSTLCLDANPEGRGKALNLLHFYFGAGAVVGPLFALLLKHADGGWRWAFGLAALGPLVVAAVVPFLTTPPSPQATASQKFAVYRKPFLWWGAFALFAYCGVEWGVGAWFPSYWKDIPGTQALDPEWATSAFWLTFAVGRFVVGPWADAWGFQRFLTLTMSITLAVTLLWLVFPQPVLALVWVLIFGFVIAGQYPTFVALISQRFPQASGQVTSFLSIFASMGTFLWPPAVGAWADVRGIEALPWAELAMTLLMLAAAGIAFRVGKRDRD